MASIELPCFRSFYLAGIVIHSCSITFRHNFPRTLEALILHLLSPVEAEVRTRKFDEIDQQKTEEDRKKLYQLFYGVFDNQFAAMDAILNGKESFARQALYWINTWEEILMYQNCVLDETSRDALFFRELVPW
ncbi:hypothetical protein CRYUN_Cryun14cG0106000 [Craigia yunnanensis]